MYSYKEPNISPAVVAILIKWNIYSCFLGIHYSRYYHHIWWRYEGL